MRSQLHPTSHNSTAAQAIQPRMNIDAERALNSLRKLRKAMREFSAEASPEQVHELRTRTRKVQSTAEFLTPGDACAARLLKRMKPVTRAAGKVRDMDVFVGMLFQLSRENAGDALVRLSEAFARKRERRLRRLSKIVEKRAPAVDRAAKSYARVVQRQADAGIAFSPAELEVVQAELEHWPKLHAENLHEFRKEAKRVRYMTQLMPGVPAAHIAALTQAKDSAGAWHDWLELCRLAAKILEEESDRELLQRMEAVTNENLRAALTSANHLRTVLFERPRAARRAA